MAIGIVSDNDFTSELNKVSPVPELKPAQIINIHRGGRNTGDTSIPEVLKDIIIDEKVTNSRASALEFAKMFSVSDSSVSAYTNGATSTKSYHTPNKRLTNKLTEAKLRVATRARKKLNLAIEQITEQKLSDASLKDLALVSKAMSGVIKDMEPASQANGEMNFNGPSIVMYNPGFTKEENFESVEISE